MAVALLQALLGVVGMSIGFALLTLPVIKFYARPLSVSRLTVIAFWAFFRANLVLFLTFIVWIIGLGKTVDSLTPIITPIIICFAGALISRSLKQYGFEKPFPGIGARAIIGLLIFMWIIVGILWLLFN